MKKLFTKLFLLCVMLSSCFSSFAYDIEVDGIYYKIISFADFTCEVTDGDLKYAGDIVIPAQIQYNNRTLDVISIGEYAFGGCSSLQSVEIPNSVTRIESKTFSGCTSLQSIAIPNSVTRIESYTFSGCTSLQSI
ncbi:MAG: leucine-rich repeat domain-containing protein, partial [Duncaniella sp.]|nr:leucine-rich repeat domain-containing protein [Duncaniella sp.]